MVKYNDESDEILVALTLTGDERAYEALVLRHQKRVLASAKAVTRRDFMAEDAAQDAFVAAWMKLDKLSDPSKFGQWVSRIARNRAVNMMTRAKQYVDIEDVSFTLESTYNVEEAVLQSEEYGELRRQLERLPQKIKTVIYLYYFEGLTIPKIAEKLNYPEGTVKWQLSEGRRTLRGELSAMNEKIDDTLVEKVMKKVEELNNWRLKDNKRGIENVYREVLAAVEALPESKERYHALADTLVVGRWWVNGEENDENLTRLRDAALRGHNEDAMMTVMAVEHDRLSGDDKIAYMRDTQIPFLKENGFRSALGYVYFWLSYEYFVKKNDRESGYAALRSVLDVLPEESEYHACVLAALNANRIYDEEAANKWELGYNCDCDVIKFVNGEPRFYAQPGYGYKVKIQVPETFYHSSLCDNRYFVKGASVGDVYTGSDEAKTLTYAESGAVVETKAGTFENCDVWVTDEKNDGRKTTVYCKNGVGIVRIVFESITRPTYSESLVSYHIAGGKGLLPLCRGNKWEYENDSAIIYSHNGVYEVTYCDGKYALVSAYQTSWLREGEQTVDFEGMVATIHEEYMQEDDHGVWHIRDMSKRIAELREHARSEWQTVYCDTLGRVLKRMCDTDPEFTPDCKEHGMWEFIELYNIVDGSRINNLFGPYSLQCKDVRGDTESELLANNDIYGILTDCLGTLWSDEWAFNADMSCQHYVYDMTYSSRFRLSHAGTVSVRAGTFDDCVLLDIDTDNLPAGWSYRGGRHSYVYAPGVGIIRVEFGEGDSHGVYELTSYDGVGEGCMPLRSGMKRRYELTGARDGLIGETEYVYVSTDTDVLLIVRDSSGREKR